MLERGHSATSVEQAGVQSPDAVPGKRTLTDPGWKGGGGKGAAPGADGGAKTGAGEEIEAKLAPGEAFLLEIGGSEGRYQVVLHYEDAEKFPPGVVAAGVYLLSRGVKRDDLRRLGSGDKIVLGNAEQVKADIEAKRPVRITIPAKDQKGLDEYADEIAAEGKKIREPAPGKYVLHRGGGGGGEPGEAKGKGAGEQEGPGDTDSDGGASKPGGKDEERDEEARGKATKDKDGQPREAPARRRKKPIAKEVRAPDIKLFEAIAKEYEAKKTLADVELLNHSIPVPYIGSVQIVAGAKAEADIGAGATAGPGAIRDIYLGRADATALESIGDAGEAIITGEYHARGKLDIPVSVHAQPRVAGSVEGKVAHPISGLAAAIGGSLTATGRGKWEGEIDTKVKFTYRDGQAIIKVSPKFTSKMRLAFDLDAEILVNIQLSGISRLVAGRKLIEIWRRKFSLSSWEWKGERLYGGGELDIEGDGSTTVADFSKTKMGEIDLPKLMKSLVSASDKDDSADIHEEGGENEKDEGGKDEEKKDEQEEDKTDGGGKGGDGDDDGGDDEDPVQKALRLAKEALDHARGRLKAQRAELTKEFGKAKGRKHDAKTTEEREAWEGVTKKLHGVEDVLKGFASQLDELDVRLEAATKDAATIGDDDVMREYVLAEADAIEKGCEELEEQIEGVAFPTGPKEATEVEEDPEGRTATMRFQVQWNSSSKKKTGPNRSVCVSEAVDAPWNKGVTLAEACTAVDRVIVRTGEEESKEGAEAAVDAGEEAKVWMAGRVPGGWDVANDSKSFYFRDKFPTQYNDARVDVNNMRGKNLRE